MQAHSTIKQPRPLVLASASPRRWQLMSQAGYVFEVVTPPVQEPPSEHASAAPEAVAESLAYFKARTVVRLRPDATILGADTIVVVHGQTIGKPRDEADARRILQTLSGSRHRVISGVALVAPGGAARMIRHAVTELYMRAMTPLELDDYIASREWEGKAGAYAIQENGDRFVSIIEGSMTNVVGLPIELVTCMFDTWSEKRMQTTYI